LLNGQLSEVLMFFGQNQHRPLPKRNFRSALHDASRSRPAADRPAGLGLRARQRRFRAQTAIAWTKAKITRTTKATWRRTAAVRHFLGINALAKQRNIFDP
jgi:hypothetical protein